MTTTLVLNALSDRVIYFTTDANYRPSFSPYTWVAYYEAPLPEGMYLSNCWSYRLRNNVLEYNDAYTLEERGLPWDQVLLLRNKKALIVDLHDKIDGLLKTGRRSPSFLLSWAQELVDAGATDAKFDNYATIVGKDNLDLAHELLAADLIFQERIERLEQTRFQFEHLISKATTQAELETARRQFNGLRD